jgi:hypothetical protein
MPEGSHPLPSLQGWKGLPFTELDGMSWPLNFAAKILQVSELDLRKEVKQQGVEPTGVIRMRDYRSQGRQPRAYPATELIRIAEAINFPDSPDSV